jgi:hypothetical protein
VAGLFGNGVRLATVLGHRLWEISTEACKWVCCGDRAAWRRRLSKFLAA